MSPIRNIGPLPGSGPGFDPDPCPRGESRPEDHWRAAREPAFTRCGSACACIRECAVGAWLDQDGDPAAQAERDRLMPQACGTCGGEVPADGAPPDHLDDCPEARS